MAVVGAAQNGYTLGISGAWYSIAGSFYFIALALFAKLIRNNMPGDSVPIYLQKRFDTKTSRLYSYAWIVYGFLYIPYQLKTVASIIQIAIPGLNITLAMLIGLTIAVIYTSFSGMRGMSAVGRIVCFGIYILLIAFVLMTLPKFGGFTVMLSELPVEYSSMGNMPTQLHHRLDPGRLPVHRSDAVRAPAPAGRKERFPPARTGSTWAMCWLPPSACSPPPAASLPRRPVRTWRRCHRICLLHQDLQQSGFRWDHFLPLPP